MSESLAKKLACRRVNITKEKRKWGGQSLTTSKTFVEFYIFCKVPLNRDYYRKNTVSN
jgi:hypothetical protein